MNTATVRMLGQLTRDRFDVWALAGDGNVRARALFMAALLGVPKVPQSKAGVNAILAECYRQSGVTGGCPAHREHNLVNYCRAALGMPVVLNHWDAPEEADAVDPLLV